MTGSSDVIGDIEVTRVLIVAGYASVRAGLHALLAGAEGVRVLGEAGTTAGGDTLARLLRDIRPDVVLLDAADGGTLSGVLSALVAPVGTRAVRDDIPALVVLGDVPSEELPRLQGARDLPGWAYLLREADGPQIVGAVRAAAEGLVVLDRSLAARAGAGATIGGGHALNSPVPSDIPGETLTAREIEVLQLMAEGLPNKIIATRLGISLHTAKFHVAQILGKLNATSRTEAVTLGARRGYVTL